MRFRLLMLAAALTLVGCGGDNGTGVNGDVTVGPGNSFSPQTLNLTTGRNVTWGWAGGTHNVTFEDAAPGSGNLSSGSFSRNFTGANAGTYRYRCTIHSANFTTGMVGSVVVP